MATVSTSLAPGARVSMSFEEYLRTPDDPNLEYIDGAAVMSPVPSAAHALAVNALLEAIKPVLPADYVALSQAGWKPQKDVWGPDVFVMPRSEVGSSWYAGVPPVVIEVPSSNRADDTIRKVQKYARAGVPQYWIVDPRDHEIYGLELRDGI